MVVRLSAMVFREYFISDCGGGRGALRSVDVCAIKQI